MTLGRRPGNVRYAGTTAVAVGALLLLAACSHHRHQTRDFTFEPQVARPAYGLGEGPSVGIDEAHCNFHRSDHSYKPFAELLRRDGHLVAPFTGQFTLDALSEIDLLVVSNALSDVDCDDKHWRLPNPSAFSAEEVESVAQWVDEGGSLLLIADHMPFPGAASTLAEAFGFAFINGYVRPDEEGPWIHFRTTDGLLADHPAAMGATDEARVTSVVSFTGQAFRALDDAVVPILTLPSGTTVRLPHRAGEVSDKTPRFSAEGLLQGAVVERGEGRVAVFGEAAMFTAQENRHGDETIRFGMNAEGAEDNPQFILNVVHWLTAQREQ